MKTQVPSPQHGSPLLRKLLTIEEVADALALTRRGVESMTKRGVLPVIKLSNRAVRYRPEAVESVLDRLTIGAVSDKPGKRVSA
ncbi:excisionase family DNA binding protein [Roseimicrobium gellanilyticum]|uniref:Excisionase family DNA binding protein n=1 Tax=Roseimicrobium gellanilyticum TaxID=748857 RepID=A0A366HI36_9BACT|nr:helix-turn-helix domain-containing protein [Roseimicrobium gellanilyticum]RBP42427.1 excisionase family DNA binding protein [Roseimicrobium gellanilyticum]